MIQKIIRNKIISLVYQTQSRHCHIGSCLSCTDIMIQTLIFEMKPQDKFILSKGHASLTLFVILNHLKKISNEKLGTYLKNGTELGIHTPQSMPESIPLATGSLGHGLSFACGVAYGYKLTNKKSRVYCLMSDGECNEGAVWEAALFASRYKLNNLIALIDKNRFQAYGPTSEVLGDAATVAKWQSFGFNTFICNGHSLKDLNKVFSRIRTLKSNKPNMVICETLRGKGIPQIENKLLSNYVGIDQSLLSQTIIKQL